VPFIEFAERLFLVLLGMIAVSISPGFCAPDSESEDTGPIVVITDMEPDDRIALHLIGVMFPERLAFIGTTVMHSFRKRMLAERLMQQLGLGRVPIFQGSGGYAEDYPDIASSRPGREYEHEGAGILQEQVLLEMADRPRSSRQLQREIGRILSDNRKVEFFLLAPATDLARVLEQSPELAEHISRAHLMGGWVEIGQPDGAELRTTYNWNMDPTSARQILESQAFPITLYSSHTIKERFSGGTVNRDNFPQLIDLLETASGRLKSVSETLVASGSWDHHLMDRLPQLEAVIGRENAGRQFSPADSIVVVGAFAPDLITGRSSVRIRLDAEEFDPNRGYRVFVTPFPGSKIQLVDDFDELVFQNAFVEAFEKL
jgi:hypothetical protein